MGTRSWRTLFFPKFATSAVTIPYGNRRIKTFVPDMRCDFSTQLKKLALKGEAAHSSQRMRIPTSRDGNGFSLPYAEDAASWAFQPVSIAHYLTHPSQR